MEKVFGVEKLEEKMNLKSRNVVPVIINVLVLGLFFVIASHLTNVKAADTYSLENPSKVVKKDDKGKSTTVRTLGSGESAETVLGGVLVFNDKGVFLYRDGVDSSKLFAPAHPSGYKISYKLDTVALVYDWDHPESQGIEGDLYISDLSGPAERTYAKPMNYLPISSGVWMSYSAGYQLKTSFISHGGNEKVCFTGSLKDFQNKELEIEFLEYGALVNNRKKQKTFDTDCVERFGQKVMLDVSGDDLRLLKQYGDDWSEQAENGQLPEIYGDDVNARVDRIIGFIKQQTKRSTMLIGKPGIGKTATVMHLANRIAAGQVPEWLKDWKVVSIRASLLSAEGLSGVAEKKTAEVVKAAAGKKVILLIDEIHQLVGLGTADGKSHDITEVFKTDLASGNLVMIGTTTPDGNELSSLKSKTAFFDRFWHVNMGEPEIPALKKIFRKISDKLERVHRVKISKEVIDETIRLSNKYMPTSYHPRKGKNILEGLAGQFETPIPLEPKEVKMEALCGTIAALTGVPVACSEGESSTDFISKVRGFHKWINNKVVGQQEAKNVMFDALALQATGLSNPDRPAGVFLFLGPSGVGKSFLAKKFTEYIFGKGMLKEFSMGNYQQEHTVAGLTGSPPGYIGSDKPGALYAWAQSAPASTILFDEIDKANRRIYDAMLPLLENGYIQDMNTAERPTPVKFNSGYVVMTSNFGMEYIAANDERDDALVGSNTCKDMTFYKENPGRFLQDNTCKLAENELKDLVLHYLLRNGKFGTFFAGRIGRKNMAIFHYLSKPEVLTIAGFLVRDMADQFKKEGYDVKVSPKVLEWAVDTGYQKNLGARGVREKIENVVGPEISKALLYGKLAGKNPKQFAVVIDSNDIKVVSDADADWRKVSKEAGY